VGDFGGIGDATIRVLGNGTGHRHRALDERCKCVSLTVGRRYDGLLPADEYPEAEIVALGAFELLGLAQTPRVRQRGAFEQHSIGGIGTGTTRPSDQILQQVKRRSGFFVYFLLGHV